MKSYKEFLAEQEAFMADVLAMRNTIHSKNKDELVKALERNRKRGGNTYSIDVLRAARKHSVQEGFSNLWVENTLDEIVQEAQTPPHIKDIVKKHGLENKTMKSTSHTVKDVTPKGYGPDKEQPDHKIGDRVKSFDFPGSNKDCYMTGKVSNVDDNFYHIDVDKCFFQGVEKFDFPKKIRAAKSAHSITGAYGVVKESEELDEGYYPTGWGSMSKEARDEWTKKTNKVLRKAREDSMLLAISLKRAKEKKDEEEWSKHVAAMQALSKNESKELDEATKDISISKIIKQYPSVKAYGLSKVTNFNGNIHTVSTYDLPKDLAKSVEELAKKLSESFDDEHGTGPKTPSEHKITKIINNIEQRHKTPPSQEDRDEAHKKHIERLKKSKEEYLKTNPNSIYKKD